MFGDQAKNLTLRTIAKIFYHLGETAYISTQQEFDRAIASARGELLSGNERWIVSGLVDDIEATASTAFTHSEDTPPLVRGRYLDEWARAEEAEAAKPRRFASAR